MENLIKILFQETLVSEVKATFEAKLFIYTITKFAGKDMSKNEMKALVEKIHGIASDLRMKIQMLYPIDEKREKDFFIEIWIKP